MYTHSPAFRNSKLIAALLHNHQNQIKMTTDIKNIVAEPELGNSGGTGMGKKAPIPVRGKQSFR